MGFKIAKKLHVFTTWLVHLLQLIVSWLLSNLTDLSRLTLSPPITTRVPDANSVDPDETSSHSVSHLDPSCLALRQYFHKSWAALKHFEKLKQTRNLAVDHLFGRLRVNSLCYIQCCYFLWTMISTIFFYKQYKSKWKYILLGYSKTSIARARIAQIPDRKKTLADSLFRFFAILNSYYCCGGLFLQARIALSANLICTSGNADL